MPRTAKCCLWLGSLLAAAAAGALLFPDQTPLIGPFWARAQLYRQMRSNDAEQRKQAAWASIENPSPRLEDLMTRGLLGDEPDVGVREAYVYSLGAIGHSRCFAAVEQTLDLDPSGFVRCAAWLAAARIDPDHFRTLVAAREQPVNDWDRLGTAQAELSLGDVSGLDELFTQCRSNDESRRYIASRALRKWLWPLLDTLGRAPRRLQPPIGDVWPPVLVDEIELRCAGLDLQAVADEVHSWREPAARTHRNVNRINGARSSVIKLLFDANAEDSL